MARIRSIHPGLFTDEAFVSMSMAARLLLPGIWTECDDQGVFEWKPITLKMRIFAADDVNVGALLDELEQGNLIRRFDVSGKVYGVVRNFAKWQKPKKPVSKFPLPTEWRTYAGYKDDSSPPVPHQFPTSGEESPLMEEGGGKKDIGGGDAGAREGLVQSEAMQLAEDLAAIAGFPTPQDWPPGWMGAPYRAQQFLSNGWRPEVMLPEARACMAKKRDGPPSSIGYFEQAFARAHARANAPLPIVTIQEVANGRQNPNSAVAAVHRLIARVQAERDDPAENRDDVIELPARQLR